MMRSGVAHELRELGPFVGCDRRQLEWARRRLTPLEFAAGSVLMNEGGLSAETMVIAGGRVVVTKGTKPVARLGRGAVVGDVGVLSGRRRSATVTAETPLEVYVASAREFVELVENVAPFARNLLIDICARDDVSAA